MKNLKDDIRDGLHELTDAVRRLRGPSDDPLQAALLAFDDAEADDLALLKRLFEVLRPQRGESPEAAVARFNRLVGLLRDDPELTRAFRRHFVGFFTRRRMIGFFADSGILPATGFFSEWSRILVQRVLPHVPDERDVKDCLHIFLTHPDDWQWLAEIPQESM